MISLTIIQNNLKTSTFQEGPILLYNVSLTVVNDLRSGYDIFSGHKHNMRL